MSDVSSDHLILLSEEQLTSPFPRRALASDTGGSTRLPAAYCGVAGLKPSYGLLSRWGMIAYASSLDCVGIMAKEVGDVRTTLGELGAALRSRRY